MKSVVLLAFLFIAKTTAQPVVETLLGTVKGTIKEVVNTKVESFFSIPYAKPPIRKLRFALPIPFGGIGDFDATQSPTMCPQNEMILSKSDNLIRNEDCLKLNIYRKEGTPDNAMKPVIIVIHGGGYSYGSGSDSFQTAISLAAYEDLIIVSPNYRLGVLGFANMKELAPGNLGLHDQRLAIKWVHDNIEAFGGDPNKITLMGVSAGSMSVGAQVVTPLNTEGYFQSVVMDAGVVNSYGYIEETEQSFRRIQKVAAKLNCSDEGVEMLQCLRGIDAMELIKVSEIRGPAGGASAFVPTKDGEFIPLDIEEYMKRKTFPAIRMIIGYSRNEGSLFNNPEGAYENGKLPELKTEEEFIDFMEVFIKSFEYPIDLKDENQKQKLVEHYYNRYRETAKMAAEFQGDGIFLCPINYFAKHFAKQQNNIFVYEFNRKLQQTYFEIFNPEDLGVYHYSSYLHFSGVALAQTQVQVPELDKQYFLDTMAMIYNFSRSNDAPVFRGVRWPDYSKSGEVLVFNEMTPIVRKGLTHEENCELFFTKKSSEGIRLEL